MCNYHYDNMVTQAEAKICCFHPVFGSLRFLDTYKVILCSQNTQQTQNSASPAGHFSVAAEGNGTCLLTTTF